MSIPVRLRRIKDTSANSKFAVEEACIQLVKHTYICCDTVDKKFPESKSISDKIRNSVLEIFTLENKANSVPFIKGKITEDNYQKRTAYIKQSMEECNLLLGYLTLGKVIYKWRASKIDYWKGLVDNVYSLLNKWIQWCEKEFLG